MTAPTRQQDAIFIVARITATGNVLSDLIVGYVQNKNKQEKIQSESECV